MADRAISSARAAEAIHARVEAAASRAGVSKALWVLAAIEEQLEADEALLERPHVPAAIEQALPRRNAGGRLMIPQGRTFDRR